MPCCYSVSSVKDPPLIWPDEGPKCGAWAAPSWADANSPSLQRPLLLFSHAPDLFWATFVSCGGNEVWTVFFSHVICSFSLQLSEDSSWIRRMDLPEHKAPSKDPTHPFFAPPPEAGNHGICRRPLPFTHCHSTKDVQESPILAAVC